MKLEGMESSCDLDTKPFAMATFCGCPLSGLKEKLMRIPGAPPGYRLFLAGYPPNPHISIFYFLEVTALSWEGVQSLDFFLKTVDLRAVFD